MTTNFTYNTLFPPLISTFPLPILPNSMIFVKIFPSSVTKFPDINQGKFGVLLGTACVPFTHLLEWIRGAHNCPSGIRTELGWTIAGEFRHSSRNKSTATKHLLFFASHETSPQSASTDILEHYWNVEQAGTGPSRRQIQGSKIAKRLPSVKYSFTEVENRKFFENFF